MSRKPLHNKSPFGNATSKGGFFIMQVSQQQYKKMYEKTSPNSNLFVDCLWAFCVGGAICALGQALGNLYMMVVQDLQVARTWVSVTLVALAAILTACKIYDNIAKYAGAAQSSQSPALPTALFHPPWSLKARDWCWGWVQKCSPLPARCWFTAPPPVLFTA